MVRFGPFEVDARLRKVSKHGIPVHVRGQSLDVLLVLLEHPGDIVTREELRARLWPDGTWVEFEPALNSIVNRLRVALGDRASRAKYIETIPRTGYRFTGTVLDGPPAQPSSPRSLRLAVLPLANLSGDSAEEYLCDGLTEELIGQLAILDSSRLSVLARTSSMHYKGTRKGIAVIARELRADLVVEGSLRRAGDRIRVSVQCIQAEGEHHVWARNYDGLMGDLLGFQESVAQAAAAQIRSAIAPQPPSAVSPAAYDVYLRGRSMAARFSSSGLDAAARCFEEAVRLDPHFARAWALLAQTRAESGFWNFAPASSALPEAGRAARVALSLDNSLAEAHRALGTVHWFHDWDLHSAREEYQRAVELNPNDAAARLSLATFLASMELDYSRALQEAARARELDPMSALIWGNTGWVPLWAREFEVAIALCRRAIELDPNEPSAYYVLGLSLAGTSRFPEAIHVLETGSRLQSGNMMLAYLATVCAIAGERAHARDLLAELERRAQTQPVLPTSFAFIHMGLGDHAAALDWLERGMRERDPHSLWLPVAARWDPLRETPRFKRLLEDLPRPSAHR